jgi:hypothetical protein
LPRSVNCIFSDYFKGSVVQHEQHDPDGDDFAKVWRRAQHRRSEDASIWLTKILKKRWQFKSPNEYVGVLIRPFTRNSEPFFPPETEEAALKGARTTGERSEQ